MSNGPGTVIIPGHPGLDSLSALTNALETVQKAHPGCVLFMSVSDSFDIDLTTVDGDNKVTEVGRSYSVSDSPSFANEGLYVSKIGSTAVCMMPYVEGYVPYVVGNSFAGKFNMGLGLFDGNGKLIDTAITSGVPLAVNKSLVLLNVGQIEGTLNWLVLHDRENTEYTIDRWTEEPTIELPAALTAIEDEAFAGNENMTGFVVVPEGVTSIGAGAFARTGIAFIRLPASVTAIAENAFIDMTPTPTLIVDKGSYAEEWANQNKYIYMYASNE